MDNPVSHRDKRAPAAAGPQPFGDRSYRAFIGIRLGRLEPLVDKDLAFGIVGRQMGPRRDAIDLAFQQQRQLAALG